MVTNMRARVDLQVLHHPAGSRAEREIAAWARYCVGRIEGDLGTVEQWTVRVAPSPSGFTATVEVRDPTYGGEVSAEGFDGALAIWDAMCRLEQRLREVRTPALVGRQRVR
jgi:hypothetical protein